jgi:hypothetical protein
MNTWERRKIGLSVLGRIHAVLRDLRTRGRHRRIARLLHVAEEAPAAMIGSDDCEVDRRL